MTALDNVSFTIPHKGYTLGIVGESGSGKSTLGLSIMNLIEPPGEITVGSLEFEGNNILAMNKTALRKYRWQDVSMIYQSAMNSLNPVKTVIDPIIEVIKEHTKLTNKEARQNALELLSQVGIKPERAYDYPHEFSGGMRQRVVIALATALSPKLLIADEPTSALDVVVQKQILSILSKRISDSHLSLIFITHEIALLQGLVENIAVMLSGEIVEIGPTEQVLFRPLHPYTEMLLGTTIMMNSTLEAIYSLNLDEKRRAKSKVQTNHCKYVNSCKYAMERCQRERPLLTQTEAGRYVACHKFS